MVKEFFKLEPKGCKNPIYVLKNWANNVDSKGCLEYFIKGEGWHTTKKFTEISVDFGDIEKNDSFAIGRIRREYGYEVAVELCQEVFGCCGYSAESWVNFFEYVERIARENFTEDEMKQIPIEIRSNLRSIFWGLPIVDICFLDDRLHEIDPESDYGKYVDGISMSDYILEKYGPIAHRYVSILIGDVEKSNKEQEEYDKKVTEMDDQLPW